MDIQEFADALKKEHDDCNNRIAELESVLTAIKTAVGTAIDNVPIPEPTPPKTDVLPAPDTAEMRIEELEKMIADLKKSQGSQTAIPVQNSGTWSTVFTWIIILAVLFFGWKYLDKYGVDREKEQDTVTLLELSEQEGKMVSDAMDYVTADIETGGIKTVDTASEALKAEIPAPINEPIVKAVDKEQAKSEKPADVKQYPQSMRTIASRIRIRRQSIANSFRGTASRTENCPATATASP